MFKTTSTPSLNYEVAPVNETNNKVQEKINIKKDKLSILEKLGFFDIAPDKGTTIGIYNDLNAPYQSFSSIRQSYLDNTSFVPNGDIVFNPVLTSVDLDYLAYTYDSYSANYIFSQINGNITIVNMASGNIRQMPLPGNCNMVFALNSYNGTLYGMASNYNRSSYSYSVSSVYFFSADIYTMQINGGFWYTAPVGVYFYTHSRVIGVSVISGIPTLYTISK